MQTESMIAACVGVGERIVSSFNLIYLVTETEVMPAEPVRRFASIEAREVRCVEHLRLVLRCAKTGTMHERRVRLDAKLSVLT